MLPLTFIYRNALFADY